MCSRITQQLSPDWIGGLYGVRTTPLPPNQPPRYNGAPGQAFYAWARREAVLLQRRDFDQLDLENVIEELDSLGRQERSHWEDHITWAIELLLEYGRHIDDQTRSRWTSELWQSQCISARQMRDNPSLRELGEAAVARCWTACHRPGLYKCWPS